MILAEPSPTPPLPSRSHQPLTSQMIAHRNTRAEPPRVSRAAVLPWGAAWKGLQAAVSTRRNMLGTSAESQKADGAGVGRWLWRSAPVLGRSNVGRGWSFNDIGRVHTLGA